MAKQNPTLGERITSLEATIHNGLIKRVDAIDGRIDVMMGRQITILISGLIASLGIVGVLLTLLLK